MNELLKAFEEYTQEYKNPQIFETKDICKYLRDMNIMHKELKLLKELFETELRVRTEEVNTTTDDYVISYSSSMLLDKQKTADYMAKKGVLQKYCKMELDVMKAKCYLTAEGILSDYQKESKKKIKVIVK